MKVSGSYTVDAPRAHVWAALNDIDVLARIVPGCQRLEQTSANEYEGTLKIGIASIKGIYSGQIRLEDVEELTHYKLIAKGRSSNAVIDGIGYVDLEDAEDGKTLLKYSGDADIGGTLASVGQRLIEGASRQLINQSLKALTQQIVERSAVPAEASSVATSDAAQNGHAAEAAVVSPAAPAAAFAPATVQPPEPPQRSLAAETARRTVVVPTHEQLQPGDVVSGMVGDFVKQRPWLPWVIVAFLVGYLLGRARN